MSSLTLSLVALLFASIVTLLVYLQGLIIRRAEERTQRLVAELMESSLAESHCVCNNTGEDCGWEGPLSDTCMLGAVGPLCPECRETVQVNTSPTTKRGAL